VEQENEEVLSETKSRPRLRMVGIVLLVILLIIGGMTLRQMWPYLVQPSPELDIEGHVVEQVADGLGSPLRTAYSIGQTPTTAPAASSCLSRAA